MADDEVKKSPEHENEGIYSNILSTAGRVAQAIPDALAKAKPLIGIPLQAAFNTDEYQARQAGYQLAKERLAEYQADAPLRNKRRKNNMTAEELREQELPQVHETRMATLKKEEAEAKARSAAIPSEQELRQNALDQREYDSRIAQAQKNFWQVCSDNGLTGRFSYEELENLKKEHPVEFRLFFEATTAMGLLQDSLSGNKNASGLLDRFCRKNNLYMLESTDGKQPPMLFRRGGQGGEDTPVLELSPDGLKEFYQNTQNPVVAEIKARDALSDNAVSGNPAMRSLSNNVKALAPYLGNSYARASKAVQSLMNDMKEKSPDTYDRSFAIHNCLQALSDFRSGKSGAMRELFSCIMPTGSAPEGELKKLGISIPEGELKKLGISIPGDVDPAKITPEEIRGLMFQIDGKEGQITFDELYDHLRENDVLGQKMQNRIGILQEASLIRMTRAARAMRGAGMEKNGNAKNAGNTVPETGSGEKESPQSAQERYVQEQVSGGDEFIKKYKLNGQAEQIGRATKKNDEEIKRIFYLAGREAEDTFAETGNWGEAQKKFAKVFNDAGVPASLVPDLWTDKDLRDQLTQTQAALGRVLDRHAAQRNNPDYAKSKMTLATPRGDARIEPSERDRNENHAQSLVKRRNELVRMLREREEKQKQRSEKEDDRRRKFRGL